MKLPVLHNLNAIKGEAISINIGYNNLVDEGSLFACVRKYADVKNIRRSLVSMYLPII